MQGKLDAQIKYTGQGIMRHKWDLFILNKTNGTVG